MQASPIVSMLLAGFCSLIGAAQAQADDTVLVPTPPVTAPTDQAMAQAKDAYGKGADLYQSGQFAAAAPEFVLAYQLSGKADLLYNAAVCFDKLREDENAIAFYQAYLTQKPDAPDRVTVQATMDAIKQSLPGKSATPAVSTQVPQATSAPTTPASLPNVTAQPAVTSSVTVPNYIPPQPATAPGPSRVPAIVTTAGAVVLLGGGAISLGFAAQANTRLHQLEPSRAAADNDIATANRDAVIGDAFIVAGALAGGVAGYLFWKEGHEAPEGAVSVSASVLPSGGYVGLSGGF